tara:strand:+ start:7408 stop:8358 length:951 start_codon:yes stop_codon:yes gene_type:complete
MSNKTYFENKKIWIAGHNGMVGRALVRKFSLYNKLEIITASSSELDLRNKDNVEKFVHEHKPDIVIIAAATVGGIHANDTYPVDFIQDNISIAQNIMKSCHDNDINKIVNLGSSCIYPKFAEQPIKEESLLSGKLETTNQWYAIAKITAVKLCQAYNKQFNRSYISVLPSNLYGPYDNFNLETSHVMPALMRKAHEAKELSLPSLSVWGSGKPLREFLHVDDLAEAIEIILLNFKGEIINVGSNDELSIKDLSMIIKDVVAFEGEIVFDSSKPDGTPRKKLDNSQLELLGWSPKINLKTGIEEVYEWFINTKDKRF